MFRDSASHVPSGWRPLVGAYELSMAAKKSRKRKSASTPWERPAPRKSTHTTLSSSDKSKAKQRAKKAGRPYPNLVDNMAVAKKKKGGAAQRKKGGKRKAAKRSSRASRRGTTRSTKDPRGGLTAAGRKMFERTQGSHLKPGVKKSDGEMTPEEMRRKGSWATRFYGRAKLPPLVDAKGRPTRFALTAAAWGEPIPKTITAARRIAAKGKRLLQRYHATR
jgi:hypothetical protein